MKKVLLGLVSVVLIVGIWFVLNNKKETKDISGKPVVKIGVSLPLTGVGADNAISVREGALMALEDWQKKDTKYDYKLVIEDDQFSQKLVSLVGNKLISLDKVNALMSIWNLSTYQYRELVRKANIPYVTCSWGHDTHDGKLIFNNQTPHSEHARALVEVLKKYDSKNVALVGNLSNGDLAAHEYIEKALEEAGINVVFKEVVHYGTNDYRILIQKMKQTNPDAVISQLIMSDLMSFSKQLREANINIPQTGIDVFDMVEDKALFEGTYFVRSSTGTEEYKERLGKRIKFLSSDCLASGYDNVDLLIYAFENAKAEDGKIPTTEEVVKVLHTIQNWKGAIGNISVQADGRIFSKASVAKIENGKAVVVE